MYYGYEMYRYIEHNCTLRCSYKKLMLHVYLGSNSLELSATWTTYIYFSSWQLWTVAIWLIQPMAGLLSLLEQHLDRMPPTVVTQATTWWETILVLVKIQEIGLVVHLPVKVCYYTLCICGPFISILRILLRPFLDHDASQLLDDRLPYVWITIYIFCVLHHTPPWFLASKSYVIHTH